MIEGSGSVPRTNGSGSRSGRPKKHTDPAPDPDQQHCWQKDTGSRAIIPGNNDANKDFKASPIPDNVDVVEEFKASPIPDNVDVVEEVKASPIPDI